MSNLDSLSLMKTFGSLSPIGAFGSYGTLVVVSTTIENNDFSGGVEE